MKRLLAVLLTSCMIAGLASPAGSGLMTEIRANTEAAFSNLGSSEGRTESAAEGAGSFDEALRSLYDNSMSATDEEVLASAQMMPSDFTAVESELGDKAKALIDYLKYYEASKSSYMVGSGDSGKEFSGSVVSEWDRQGEYTSYVVSADDKVRTLVPRIKVNSCSVEGKTTVLDIYEWMTVGYAADEVSAVNAAAYGYTFSLKLDCDRKGEWKIASVEDTDSNFDWMEEEIAYSLQAESEDTDPLRVFSEDGEQEMMAAVAATSYTYNVSKAIAYADKYCINYNSSYNSYKGKGGDCANFVSQCLYNGGFKQDSVWYKHSVAWINVMKQIAHFKQYGTFMNASDETILKGNPIYFDWNGDSTYDHATICVGRNNSGKPILDSHTKDLYHATWDNWSFKKGFKKAATIQLRGSSSSSSTTVSGKWKSNSTGKWYEYADGTYLKSCFKTIDGKRYYFNDRGYAVKGLQKIGGKYYFFNSSTCVMTTGWVTYKGNKYYFGSDGAAYTEWEEIGGNYYYFNPTTCVMAKGFYKVKTKLHYFNSNGVEQFGWITVSGKKYYLDKYGVVQFGWQTVGGKKYYFDTNGAMVTGIVQIDGVIHEFNTNGVYKGKSSATSAATVVDTKKNTTKYGSEKAPAVSSGTNGWVQSGGKYYYYVNGKMKKGWLQLDGKYYYLGSNGARLTGWKSIGGKLYYFTSKGVMKTGWLLVNNHYYYFNSDGSRFTGWKKMGGNWYYFQTSNGAMKTGWLRHDGQLYYLGSNGKMRTGWVKINGKYFFFNKSGDMKTGWHHDADGNTYYLGSNGVMATGRRVINGRTYYFDSWGALQD